MDVAIHHWDDLPPSDKPVLVTRNVWHPSVHPTTPSPNKKAESMPGTCQADLRQQLPDRFVIRRYGGGYDVSSACTVIMTQSMGVVKARPRAQPRVRPRLTSDMHAACLWISTRPAPPSIPASMRWPGRSARGDRLHGKPLLPRESSRGASRLLHTGRGTATGDLCNHGEGG
jgi:hypothetical protein